MIEFGHHHVVERCEHCRQPLVYDDDGVLVLKARVVKIAKDQSRVTALCKHCKQDTTVSSVQRPFTKV